MQRPPEDAPVEATSSPVQKWLPAATLGARTKAFFLTPALIVVTLGVGWLAWSVVEWRNGRTPSYRRTNLRVFRTSGGRPAGLGRSALREMCCALLLVPTVLGCCVLVIGYAMGASPPEGIFGLQRRAPWDFLTRTVVVDESPSPSNPDD